tara:strand:+ start:4053 stop:6317 length:2265 start_codon:yes stop_codon:yes gene_type:complete
VNEIITKLRSFAKEHFYVIVLLLLALFFFHSIISTTKIMNNIHYINDVTFYSFNMKEAIKDGTLPLWTHYFYSGRPLFAQPEYYFIDFNFLLILLTGNIYLAMNFSVIIHLFLAGLGMYLLVNYLSDSKKAAFISALIYMFNGFMHSFVVPGNIMIIEGYSLIPFTFFFTIKALKNKNFIFNSIIAGLFIALQIFVGGVIFLPYIFLLIVVYSIVYLADKNFTNRILKLAIVGILILVIGLGVSAVKLLPGLEFLNLSNRSAGLSYEQYLGEPILLKNFVFTFITNVFLSGSGLTAAIGIAGLVLLVFGLEKYKSRIILFSALIVLLALFMSHETFLTKIFFSIPIFNQARHIERSVFLFAFAASILVGFGFLNLQLYVEKFKKFNKKFLFPIIISLILIELVLLQNVPQSIDVINPNEIPILDYMSKDPSNFRSINLALSTFIGATGYNYNSQLGISEIKGGSGIWFSDYVNFLAIGQNAPAKFWGVLNNKYAVLDKKTDIEDLKLVDRFEDCRDCTIWEAFGPYLYENTNYLPRYHTVPNSILVVGDNALVRQLVYNLMFQNWNPQNTILIEGTKINDYSSEFLNRFNIILLVTGSLDENSIPKLQEFVAQGGILVPDILNGQNTVSDEAMTQLFNQTTGNFTEINITKLSSNKITLDLSGQKGWLVASERFTNFPGWKASINGNNVEIFRADNIISSVYLNGQKGKLEFEYKPNSYKRGRLISIITIILILAYAGFIIYRKKFRSGGQNKA